MIRKSRLPLLAILAFAGSAVAGTLELRRATVDAWQDYLRSARVQMQLRLDGERPFLWADESAERAARLRSGEIVVAPLVGRGTQNVPDGLVHHWIGAVFLPDASIEDVLAMVHDYDRYAQIYKPVVTASKSLGADGNDQEFSMTWQRHVVFVNAAIQAEYHAHDATLDSHRRYSVIEATRIRQIEDYRHRTEHLLPPDTGSGFIWRIHTVTRYEERDGGVYLEIEAIALSRDIPASVRWIAVPVVNRLSVSSLTTTLDQTRLAVGTRNVTRAMLGRTGRN
jgi:hypothetical protein